MENQIPSPSYVLFWISNLLHFNFLPGGLLLSSKLSVLSFLVLIHIQKVSCRVHCNLKLDFQNTSYSTIMKCVMLKRHDAIQSFQKKEIYKGILAISPIKCLSYPYPQNMYSKTSVPDKTPDHYHPCRLCHVNEQALLSLSSQAFETRSARA